MNTRIYEKSCMNVRKPMFFEITHIFPKTETKLVMINKGYGGTCSGALDRKKIF